MLGAPAPPPWPQMHQYKLGKERLVGLAFVSPDCYSHQHKTDLLDKGWVVSGGGGNGGVRLHMRVCPSSGTLPTAVALRCGLSLVVHVVRAFLAAASDVQAAQAVVPGAFVPTGTGEHSPMDGALLLPVTRSLAGTFTGCRAGLALTEPQAPLGP